MSHEVVAALIIQSGKVLLGQRSATRAFYPGVWDVFGGHVEPGEQHHQTLIRELQEELDITATGWKYLETITASLPSPTDEPAEPLTLHLYLVTQWTGIPTNRQLDEHGTIGWFALAEATQLQLAHRGYPALFARYLAPNSKP
jgi:mutator protein MutT